MLKSIQNQGVYQEFLDAVKVNKQPGKLGLLRSARLPLAAALCEDLNVPILIVTDRTDRALLMFDELNFWLPGIPKYYFPEPTPMFYEQAAWGSLARRERLAALARLSLYHKPGTQKPGLPCVVVAPIRAVMTRTLPRRQATPRTSQTSRPAWRRAESSSRPVTTAALRCGAGHSQRPGPRAGRTRPANAAPLSPAGTRRGSPRPWNRPCM